MSENNTSIIAIFTAFSTRLGYEEHIPGQTRDWNEEIQTTRELPRKTLPERLIRERAIFKVSSVVSYLTCLRFHTVITESVRNVEQKKFIV